MADGSYISHKAKIHSTALIGPNVCIFGRAVVGPYCHIESNVVLGSPNREFVWRMAQEGRTPAALAEYDDYFDDTTELVARCCVRFGSVIGAGTRLDEQVFCDVHTHVGVHCVIGRRTRLVYGARLYDNVQVGDDCRVAGFCCDRSVIESGAAVYGELIHAFRRPGTEELSPRVGRGATVGWHAVVVGGIEIGQGAYVAAGAVVVKSVPENHIVIPSSPQIAPLGEWKGRLSKKQE